MKSFYTANLRQLPDHFPLEGGGNAFTAENIPSGGVTATPTIHTNNHSPLEGGGNTVAAEMIPSGGVTATPTIHTNDHSPLKGGGNTVTAEIIPSGGVTATPTILTNDHSPLEGGVTTASNNPSLKPLIRHLIATNPNVNLSAFSRAGILLYKPKLKEASNKLRYARNLPEVLLWNQVKRDALGADFHRQKAIGSFVVDLFCAELMLAIEIDGNVHNEEAVMQYDKERQQKLEACGIDFLRFTARDVLENMDGVVRVIQDYINKNSTMEKLSQLERGVYNRNRDLFDIASEVV